MLLTVTPNTALDRIETLPSLQPGQVLRSSSTILSPGGKGVNVARAIKNLRGQVTCAGFLGGHTGRQHAQLVNHEGLAATWTWTDYETRAAIVILDEQTGDMTVINEEGPTVSDQDWERLQTDVLSMAVQADGVCLCGSLPLGLEADRYAELVRMLIRARVRIWVDASGPALRAAVQSRPTVVKVNGLEAAGLLGWREIQDVPSALQAAQTIQQTGLSQVVLTLGKLGAVLASDAGAWFAHPPEIQAICPIGSGDAFLGGLALAWMNQAPDPDGLRQAVAVGAANALLAGGGNLSQQDYDRILSKTTVNKLA